MGSRNNFGLHAIIEIKEAKTVENEKNLLESLIEAFDLNVVRKEKLEKGYACVIAESHLHLRIDEENSRKYIADIYTCSENFDEGKVEEGIAKLRKKGYSCGVIEQFRRIKPEDVRIKETPWGLHIDINLGSEVGRKVRDYIKETYQKGERKRIITHEFHHPMCKKGESDTRIIIDESGNYIIFIHPWPEEDYVSVDIYSKKKEEIKRDIESRVGLERIWNEFRQIEEIIEGMNDDYAIRGPVA